MICAAGSMRMCTLALLLLLLTCLNCTLPEVRGAAAPARPSPLRRAKSWEEAWAALSPYQLSPVAAAACNSSSGPTVAASCGEAGIQELWKQWKIKYKVNYNNAQNTLRYGYFRTTVRSLAAKLAVCPRTVWLGLNYRADWSLNELRLNRKLFVPRIKPNVLLKNVKLPLKWDWSSRAEDKVTPAKDQGRCGSCFAFAAVAAVESKLLIQYGKKFSEYAVDLSEQQMVDCVVPSQGNYYSDGCGGGYLEEPLVYASRWFMVKEDLYGYTSGTTGVNGTCDATRTATITEGDKVQLTGGGFNQLQSWSAKALRQEVRKAPVMVGFYVPDDSLFEFFSGGVWPASSCPLPPGAPSASLAQVNHALLVVGYDMTIKDNHHWIVKNSYGNGEEWGENGFGRIAMLPDGTYGTCFMYYYMVSPTELVPTNLPVVPEPARTSLRLTNPNKSITKAGRLEVYHNGQWGTVCDDRFNDAAATVVCQQLRLGNAGTAVPNAFYGEGIGHQWLDEVSCHGGEERLEVCAHAGWSVTNCGHKEDVGVSCRTVQETVRLVNATAATRQWSGRLELLYRGSWTPVCKSGFDIAAATVVCKQLGLGMSGTLLPDNTFGRGLGFTRLASINCTGAEARWQACRSAVWENTTCGSAGDAAVACIANAPSVRLVSGSITSLNSRLTQGRLEVLLASGAWSTVCDDGFTDQSATVVCRQLGMSSAGFAMPGGSFGEGKGPIAWGNVACTGTEATIQQCPRAAANKVDCTHREDVGVICSNTNPRVKPAVPVRLRFGGTYGPLLVKYGGVWGSVCGDFFNDAAATVACRQLGFKGRGIRRSYYWMEMPGFSGPILLDDVQCKGNETSLDECQHAAWGVHNCGHMQDVWIECFRDPWKIRLTNGTRQMGHLEVRVNGRWGDVCASLDYRSIFQGGALAEVACRQLGLPLPALHMPGAFWEIETAPLAVSAVVCQGSEARLDDCYYINTDTYIRVWPFACLQTVDVACNATVAWRLANTTNNGTAGRLEVSVNGVWGQVLKPKLEDSDGEPVVAKGSEHMVATVACRELGLPAPGRMLPGDFFGTATGPTFISDISECHDDTMHLQECAILWGGSGGWLSAVAIQCGATQSNVRVVGRDGKPAQAGRLEVRTNSTQPWGAVCDRWANFDTREAAVICRSLGLPPIGRSVGGSYWGAGPTAAAWPTDASHGCAGEEAELGECNSGSPIDPVDPSCKGTMQVGVECGVEPLRVRLANKSADGRSGRPELLWQGRWGTICCGESYCFSNTESLADKLCSRLRLPTPGRLVDTSVFGPGNSTSPVLFDKARCREDAPTLDSCDFSLNTAKCGHSQDVGLQCGAPRIAVRLVGGVPGRSGRLEVLVAGRWGMACNKGGLNKTFSNREAMVVCRQLGFPLPGRVVRNGAFGPGSGPVFTSNLDCSGAEQELTECRHGFYGNSLNCTPAEAANVECGYKPTAMKLRLQNVAENDWSRSGRLEVLYKGQWGMVDMAARPIRPRQSVEIEEDFYGYIDAFNSAAAAVACRQLGYKGGGSANAIDPSDTYRTGPVWTGRVVCKGDEPGLEYCSYDPFKDYSPLNGTDASFVGLDCRFKP